jgi:enterochelin esterase-like enzyme
MSVRSRRGTIPALALALLASLAARASGQAGRVVELIPPAPSLEANLLGDDPRRTALVYLPPSYSRPDSGPFPIVYLLHGFGVGPESWRGGANGYEDMDIAATLDGLVASGAVEEMIVVMPDARTRYGGSWYGASRAIGDWERYIAVDLVRAVDDAYRTLARREARALVGQSMGAYGALRIASAHPEVFGIAVAVSAPNLMHPNPLGMAALEAALRVPSPDAVLEGSPLPAVIWSKAAAFSPDAEAAPFFATLPVAADGDTLVLDPVIWPAWERNTVRGLLSRPERRRALGSVDLRLDVGGRDPLRGETRSLVDRLRSLGIEVRAVEFDGGHVEGVRAHLTRSLFPWLSSRFERSRAGGEPAVRTPPREAQDGG